jgi:hypothetical protein
MVSGWNSGSVVVECVGAVAIDSLSRMIFNSILVGFSGK